jgi:hypothetical protein
MPERRALARRLAALVCFFVSYGADWSEAFASIEAPSPAPVCIVTGSDGGGTPRWSIGRHISSGYQSSGRGLSAKVGPGG